MSGICGILRFDGGGVAERDLARVIGAMRHLGPDRRRTWREDGIGLGHLQLRVTQEDFFDAQPLQDREAALTLVADARIDNREEIAGALAIDAAALREMPDSALILHAYRKWGEDCVAHLVGDFAFAVWDAKARKLVLARDHMGQRHVMFHHAPSFFAFATEIKGLWALGDVPRVLIEEKLGSANLQNTDKSIAASPYEGIAGVPGGTVMTIAADGTTRTRRYWEPRADPRHEGHDEAYYVEAYRRVLGEAVACRLRRTTHPAALFFGGGFDSTAIAALAGPVVTAQNRKFICVSSVMPADYRGTIRHARRWGEICARDMPHVEMRYVTREGRDIFTVMEKSFRAADTVTSTGGYVTDEIRSAMLASGARVVMDGFGGDYTLNVRNFPWLFALLRRGRLSDFLSEFRAYRRHSGLAAWRILRNEIGQYLVPAKAIDWRRRWRQGLQVSGQVLPVQPRYAGPARSGPARPTTGAAMRAYLHATLVRLQSARSLAGSLQAAACGLEFTQPFHDKRVIELALAIPEDLWVKNGRDRHLARIALKDLYPPEFQTRQRGNDDIAPDFLAMVKRVEPRILAEIDRMEREGRLSHHFDFPRMRRMLTQRPIEKHRSGSEYDTHKAVSAFLRARYIEWFRRDNN
jgi:asparagine synthase (glutamine-hydrolysing)